MRTIIIGDVHGCLDELLTLVSRCRYAAGDRLILVGDLVAKGPDSIGVVSWARESRVEAVLGNHEEHVLRARRDLPGAKPKHRRLAEALGAEDAAWLEALPLFLPAGQWRGKPLVVVHAGLVPGVAIEAQQREHLLNLRSLRSDGSPSKAIEGAPWAASWSGPEQIVFGHDSLRGLQQYPSAIGLDTGCVYGRRLTALILPEGRLVSVSARHAYASRQSEAA
jgi:Calcineurin-like phosphoesterase